MNDPYKQINHLIERGFFNGELKKRHERSKSTKRTRITVLIFLFSVILIWPAQMALSGVTRYLTKWQTANLTSSLRSDAPDTTDISSVSEETPAKATPPKIVSIFESIPALITNNGLAEKSEINILMLGQAGEGYAGGELTDTIMVVHIEPVNKSASLVSIPRDLLVTIPNRNYKTKINAVYKLSSINDLKEIIANATGLSIDYYAVIDLTVVKEMINLIGGLNVYVPEDINDPRFPSQNYAYETFKLEKGWRYLDGANALRYIRTRYTSPNGDFDRMARQQQVIGLLKRKVLELNPLWDFPTYIKIFDSLKSRIRTDLSVPDIRSLWITAGAIKSDEIRHLVLDKKETGLMTSGPFLMGSQEASVVYPVAGIDNYETIKQYIANFINL